MNSYKQNNYDSTDDNYIPSTDDIYNLLMAHPEYSKNIKKGKRSIIVYSDINPRKNIDRKNKLKEILKYIKGEEKLNRRLRKITIYDEKPSDSVDGISSSIGRVEVFRAPVSKNIVIFLKPSPKHWTNINWRLNEEMFSEIATEYAGYSEENGKFLNIVITDGSKKISINNVKSIVRVGSQNKKSDIKITSITGTTNISLKLPQFNSWQSYANSDDSAVKNAKKVLKNLPNFTAAFQNNNNGVYVKSTIEEVKQFCFGGTGGNKVDYILVSNFPGKQLAKSFIFDGMRTLKISVDKIYDINKPHDITAIQSNCYMLIKKTHNSNANITSEYKGYTISFVPEILTQYAMPGKR
jgi:hypothetical protein